MRFHMHPILPVAFDSRHKMTFEYHQDSGNHPASKIVREDDQFLDIFDSLPNPGYII